MRDQQAYEQQREIQQQREDQQQRLEVQPYNLNDPTPMNRPVDSKITTILRPTVTGNIPLKKLTSLAKQLQRSMPQMRDEDEEIVTEQDNEDDKPQIGKMDSNKKNECQVVNCPDIDNESQETSSCSSNSNSESSDEEGALENKKEDQIKKDSLLFKKANNSNKNLFVNSGRIDNYEQESKKTLNDILNTEQVMMNMHIMDNVQNVDQACDAIKNGKPQYFNSITKSKEVENNGVEQKIDHLNIDLIQQNSGNSSEFISRRIKKQKKRRMLNAGLSQIPKQKCLVDTQMLTQRDRSQFILYQETFKLSQLDCFYVGKEVDFQTFPGQKDNEGEFNILEEKEDRIGLSMNEMNRQMKRNNIVLQKVIKEEDVEEDQVIKQNQQQKSQFVNNQRDKDRTQLFRHKRMVSDTPVKHSVMMHQNTEKIESKQQQLSEKEEVAKIRQKLTADQKEQDTNIELPLNSSNLLNNSSNRVVLIRNGSDNEEELERRKLNRFMSQKSNSSTNNPSIVGLPLINEDSKGSLQFGSETSIQVNSKEDMLSHKPEDPSQTTQQPGQSIFKKIQELNDLPVVKDSPESNQNFQHTEYLPSRSIRDAKRFSKQNLKNMKNYLSEERKKDQEKQLGDIDLNQMDDKESQSSHDVICSSPNLLQSPELISKAEHLSEVSRKQLDSQDSSPFSKCEDQLLANIPTDLNGQSINKINNDQVQNKSPKRPLQDQRYDPSKRQDHNIILKENDTSSINESQSEIPQEQIGSSSEFDLINNKSQNYKDTNQIISQKNQQQQDISIEWDTHEVPDAVHKMSTNKSPLLLMGVNQLNKIQSNDSDNQQLINKEDKERNQSDLFLKLEEQFVAQMPQFAHDQESEHKLSTCDKRLEEKQKRRQQRRQLIQQNRQIKMQEFEKFYETNLLDVDVYAGILQNPLFANSTFRREQADQQCKNVQRELIQDSPNNKLMMNQYSNINQSLRYEYTFSLKIDLDNMNYIINKAILQSVDTEKVHKIELKHFRELYGRQFEDLLDSEIQPLWNQQAKILFHFDNILKYENSPIEKFVQIYCSLEMQMSALLMNRFSNMKIIYQDQNDQWFTLNFAQESYLLQKLDYKGPWSFFDKLFLGKDQKQLYKHRNIYSHLNKNSQLNCILKKSFKTSQNISNNYYFQKLVINQKRSDVVYIPFVNDQPDQQIKKLFEIMRLRNNHSGFVQKEQIVLNQMPVIKKGLVISHLFDNPMIKDRNRQFSSKHIDIEKQIIEEDILSKEQLNATFNYPYSIEFLKDIKTHILMHKENLFLKIAQFYLYRNCFERNSICPPPSQDS